MIELTKDNYLDRISSKKSPVLVLFWSPNDPCSVALYQQMAERAISNLPLYSLDIVKQQEVAITVELMGIPTVLAVANNQVLLRLSGPSGCKNWEKSIKDWGDKGGFL